MEPQTLDQDVVNLAKAIRQAESGNKAVLPQEGSGFGGASRYQYSHDTWKEVAKKYLGDENAPLTLQNENKATYLRIKDWKDNKHYNIGQIASLWQNGSEPNGYLGTFSNGKPSVGINDYGVRYDVPAYAQKVARNYQVLKAQNQVLNRPQQQVQQPQQQEGGMWQGAKQFIPGLESDLSGRLKDAYTAGSGALKSAAQGNLGSAAAGAFNTLGAFAGGLGDVFNRTLELVPGVVQAENAIGNTETMKGLGQDIQKFSEANPETSKLIGSGLNIASALPILGTAKGLVGMAGRVADKAAVKSITKEALGDLEHAAGSGKTSQNLVKKGTFQSLVDDNLLPEVTTNHVGVPVFNSEKALGTVQNKLDDVIKQQDEILGKQTAKYNAQQVGSYVQSAGETAVKSPLHDALSEMKKHFEKTYDTKGTMWVDQMEKKLASDGVTVGEINDVARKLGEVSKSFTNTGDLSTQTTKVAMENLRKGLKDLVANRDVTGEVRKLDKTFNKLKDQQKALTILSKNKKAPLKKKGGLVRKTLANVLGSAGEAAGKAAGVPITGAIGGRGLAGLIEPKAISSVQKLNDLRTKSTLGRQTLRRGLRAQGLTKLEESTRR